MKKIIIGILILASTLLTLTGCEKPVFNGSSTGNDTRFIMDFTVLNETRTHQMPLQAGDVLDVVIEKEEGRLDILVRDSTGEVIYKGDDADSAAFSLEITRSDTYTFSVTGVDAKGNVSFIVAK